MKRIYLHSSDNEKISVLERLCGEQKIEIRMLRESDINRTLADICGVKMGSARTPAKAPLLYGLPELLIFFGMDDKGLDLFLDAYNRSGVEKIQRKAVITPTNLGWSLYELAEELGKESALNKQ